MNLQLLRLLQQATPIASTMSAALGSLDGVTTRDLVTITVLKRTTWGDIRLRLVSPLRSACRVLSSTTSTKRLAYVLAGNPE